MVEKNDEKPFKIKRLTPEEIEEQEEFYEKRENRENRDIFLKLKYKSWINFFRVWYMKREPIKLADGSGLGNYSTLITVLEGQFREKTGFDESFYDLLESDDPIVKGAVQELKSFKKRRAMFEVAKEVLAYNLDGLIYQPIREFIKSINTEEKPYDLGPRKEIYKYIIEKAIDFLENNGRIFLVKSEMKKKLKKERIYPEIDCPKCKKSFQIEPFLEQKCYYDDCIEIDCPECEHLFSIKCVYETIERMWERT